MLINLKGLAASAILALALGSAAAAAPRLQLGTVAIGPVLVASGAVSQQTVEAANSGDGTLNLTAQTTAGWLTASLGALRPCSKTPGNCVPVNLALTPGSLAVGTYTEYAILTDPNAVDSPQQISVTMTVGGIPDSVTLYAAPVTVGAGGTPTNTIVYPTSAVTGTPTTTSGGNWLQFTLTGGGSFSFGSAYSIQATPLPAMAPGVYSGSIPLVSATNAADTKTVGVTFNVTTAPIIQLPLPTIRINAYTGVKTSSAVGFTNLGQGSLALTGATIVAGGVPATTFTATTSGNGVTINVDPGTLAAGVYNATLSIASNAANNSSVVVPISLQVQAAKPTITQGGVINIATYQLEGIAQGGLAAVFGDLLAPAGTALSSPTVPLATTLAGVQVLVNGVAAPLFYVSTNQINFQVPYDVPGGTTASVQVVSGAVTSNVRSIPVVASIPRIMPWPAYLVPGNNGIVVNYGDGSLVLPTSIQLAGFKSHPAKPGDLLVIYCLGLGQTSPAAVTGAAGLAQAVPNATVTFGGGFSGPTISAAPLFVGLSGGAVGLYQVNVYVPQDITVGPNVSVTISVPVAGGNAISNFVTIPISNNGQ